MFLNNPRNSFQPPGQLTTVSGERHCSTCRIRIFSLTIAIFHQLLLSLCTVMLGKGFELLLEIYISIPTRSGKLKIDLPPHSQSMKFPAFHHKNSDSEHYFNHFFPSSVVSKCLCVWIKSELPGKYIKITDS